jgi:NADPH:quinone reductase-like Zn-dependent oxidoreductase
VVISVPAERVVLLPDDIRFEAGATAQLNYLTGLFALVSTEEPTPGKRCWCMVRPAASARPRSN